MQYNLIVSRDINHWIKDSLNNIAIDYWTTWGVKKKILLEFKVKQAVPYGIDNKTRERDIDYLLYIYPIILEEMKDILNSFHGISRSTRYWSIILGPWLYTFISVMLHHWKSIHMILKDYDINKVNIISSSPEVLIPKSYLDFKKIHQRDIWDQNIYGDIIKYSSNIDFTDLSIKKNSQSKNIQKNKRVNFLPKKKQLLNQIKKRVAYLIIPLTRILTRKEDALIVSTCLPFWEEVKLNFLLGQFPLPRLNKELDKSEIDYDIRKRLYPFSRKFSGFESYIRSRIFLHIPTIYLEGFKLARGKALNLPWPSKPKFIYTASNFDWDELFKIYTAEKVDNGSKYIIGQHGGNYGVAKFLMSEWHERKSSDYFLTWGWGGNDLKSKKSIFVLKAGAKKHGLKISKDCDKLLLVQRQGAEKKFSWDESFDYIKYLQNQKIFTQNIKNNIYRNLLVRLYADEHALGWFEEEFWQENFPEAKIDNGTQPIDNLYKKAKITVFTMESTGFIELVYLNRPCIMFYDKDYLPIRQEAREIYQILEKYKLIHRSAEDAANFINLIWDDISSWWDSFELQKVKKLFLSNFGRVPTNFLSELVSTLKSCQ